MISLNRCCEKKTIALGSEVITVCFAPDDAGKIAREIQNCLDDGADLIVTSGAMFLVARIGEVPVPSCLRHVS